MHANSNDFESPSKIIHNRVRWLGNADAMGETGKLLGKKSKGNSCLVHPAFVITVRKCEVCEGQNECWLQGQGQSHYRRHDMGVVWRTKSLMWWERKRQNPAPFKVTWLVGGRHGATNKGEKNREWKKKEKACQVYSMNIVFKHA